MYLKPVVISPSSEYVPSFQIYISSTLMSDLMSDLVKTQVRF